MNSKYGTILIIDDNPTVLIALKICLGKVFDRILTLSSPDHVLVTLRQEPVDIILLDMNFSQGVNSGQDGMIWLSAIHRRHPDIPVVLITAYADVRLAVRGLKNGAADFVTKPWDNDELIRILKDAVDRQSAVMPLHEVEREHVKIEKTYEKNYYIALHGNHASQRHSLCP